jgi:hypothetical protein
MIPALGRLRQKEFKFKGSLDYIVCGHPELPSETLVSNPASQKN